MITLGGVAGDVAMRALTQSLMIARWFLAACVSAFCCLLLAAQPASAEVIDFETPASGSTLVDHYANLGVRFNAPLVRNFASTPGFTHSGVQAIEVCFAAEFCPTPISIEFGSSQTRVAMWVGSSFPTVEARTVELKAFDGNGAQVAQNAVVVPINPTPIPTSIQIAVTTPTAVIRRVSLSYAANPSGTFNTGLVVDDVEFDATGFITCNAATFPVISLTNPADQTTVSANNFLVQGQVTTEGPLLEAGLEINSSTGTRRIELLNGLIGLSGGPFATQLSGALSPGSNQLIFRIRNCRGQVAVTRIVNLNPITSGTRFKLSGLEVVQATQDLSNSVPLVADKATIVRTYLTIEGSTDPIVNVTGDLIVTRVGGTPVPPVVHSMNSITVDTAPLSSKRGNINSSLNFRLPPEHIGAGTYHIEISRLTVGGIDNSIPCEGCGNLDSIGAPRWSHFQPTKNLNLVIVPYRYTLAPATQTPDLIFTPMATLQWVNNVFPLHGRFPVAGSGINLLRIMPMRDTNKNLEPFGADGGDFLDELEDLLDDLRDQYAWPDDVRLLAMTPCGCGGRARQNGSVLYADIGNEESGLTPQSGYTIYGEYWSHELAHTFGRKHAPGHTEKDPDSSFPYPHGSLGEPGLAIITEWWVSYPRLFVPATAPAGQPHLHDIMSYGATRWASPYTYKALFNRFLQTTAQAAAPAVAEEKLVVIGHVNADGTTSLRPFRRVISSRRSAAVSNTPYVMQLIDASSRVLVSHYFKPLETEDSSSLGFNEYVTWHPAAREIFVKGPKGILAKRVVSRNAPWIKNVRATPAKRKQTTIISWNAGDPDGDQLHATVFYRTSPAEPWMAIATASRRSGVDIDNRTLPGSRAGQLRVRVSDGVNTSEATGTIAVPSKRPSVVILGKRTMRLKAGTHVELSGAAYDPEDGLINGDQLTWSTTAKTQLGKGPIVDLSALPAGSHALNLKAVDRDGNAANARVTVIITGANSPGKRKAGKAAAQ